MNCDDAAGGVDYPPGLAQVEDEPRGALVLQRRDRLADEIGRARGERRCR